LEASPNKYSVKLYLEKTHHKKGLVRVAQGIGPKFKPQHHTKKRKKERKKGKKRQEKRRKYLFWEADSSKALLSSWN
jgi:hypothetical protein